jgi:flagellar protein FlaF
LLKAAKQLHDVATDWTGADERMHAALLFNRKLWAIFMSAAMEDDNPQSREIRQNIANLGIFVMKQTSDMQVNPDPRKLQSLININRNIAAGLSGRA